MPQAEPGAQAGPPAAPGATMLTRRALLKTGEAHTTPAPLDEVQEPSLSP